MFRVQPRKRGVDEPSSIYTHFLGRIDKAAEKTGIAYLEAVRRSILESPVKVREHIKTYDKGNVLMKEIHRETLPPDIRGALWWLERRFPEQFDRRDQMEHTGKVDVQATQTQERKLTATAGQRYLPFTNKPVARSPICCMQHMGEYAIWGHMLRR